MIEINNLSKRFRRTEAVAARRSGIVFSMTVGEC